MVNANAVNNGGLILSSGSSGAQQSSLFPPSIPRLDVVTATSTTSRPGLLVSDRISIANKSSVDGTDSASFGANIDADRVPPRFSTASGSACLIDDAGDGAVGATISNEMGMGMDLGMDTDIELEGSM